MCMMHYFIHNHNTFGTKLSARAGNGVGYKYRGNFLYAVDASGNETLESRMKQCREYLRTVTEKSDSLDKE